MRRMKVGGSSKGPKLTTTEELSLEAHVIERVDGLIVVGLDLSYMRKFDQWLVRDTWRCRKPGSLRGGRCPRAGIETRATGHRKPQQSTPIVTPVEQRRDEGTHPRGRLRVPYR